MLLLAANEKDFFSKLIDAVPKILNWLTCFKGKEVLCNLFFYWIHILLAHWFSGKILLFLCKMNRWKLPLRLLYPFKILALEASRNFFFWPFLIVDSPYFVLKKKVRKRLTQIFWWISRFHFCAKLQITICRWEWIKQVMTWK